MRLAVLCHSESHSIAHNFRAGSRCVPSILLLLQIRDGCERNMHRRGFTALLPAAEIHRLAAIAGAQLVDGLVQAPLLVHHHRLSSDVVGPQPYDGVGAG